VLLCIAPPLRCIGGGAAAADQRGRRQRGDHHPGPTALEHLAAVRLRGDVVSELCALAGALGVDPG